jgi:hypothetical protein
MIKIEALDNNGYRNFGLVMAVFFTVIFGIVLPYILNYHNYIWPFTVAIIFTFIAVIAPRLLKYIYTPWMILGHYLGAINTKIILTLVFIIVFVPMAFLLKLFGKDPMRRSNSKLLNTYWISSKKQDKNHMEKIY